MLNITINACKGIELFDESKCEFINRKGLEKDQSLQLEHSLISLSKWESKWHKPFLGKEEKSEAEIIDYIKCMTLTQNVDPNVYQFLTNKNLEEINAYIQNPMTATKIYERATAQKSKEIVTSELIYYWMIEHGIPSEYQKWHLNRLLMLIRVCNVKRQPPKKMTKKEIMSRNTALNAARRKQINSKG